MMTVMMIDRSIEVDGWMDGWNGWGSLLFRTYKKKKEGRSGSSSWKMFMDKTRYSAVVYVGRWLNVYIVVF